MACWVQQLEFCLLRNWTQHKIPSEQDWLLLSFAAPVLGGTSIAGGKVSVVGAVIGACLLTVLQNGLVIAGASPYWVDALYGVALVLAFAADRLRRRRSLRIAPV